jgi:hypothetical protein
MRASRRGSPDKRGSLEARLTDEKAARVAREVAAEQDSPKAKVGRVALADGVLPEGRVRRAIRAIKVIQDEKVCLRSGSYSSPYG